MMFELRKKEANGELPKFLDDFADPFFAKHAPAVGDTVFKNAFPDGSARSTGFLMVWRGPEGVTVKVTDDEIGGVWQFTADTFERALKRCEDALQKGLTPNRSPKSRPQRVGGKKK